MPYPSVKLDEKHDGEIDELVQSTIFEIHLKFWQKWDSEEPKMVLAQF